MKKKVTVIMLLLAMFVLGTATACGKKDEPAETPVTSNEGNTEEEQSGMQDAENSAGQDTDELQEDALADENLPDDTVNETDATDSEDNGMVKEYTLQFYQYGEYLNTAGLQMTDTEFRLINPETEEIQEVYSYTLLSDSLIALYVEEAQAYTICYYKISGFDYTLNILGATAEALLGTYQVNYVDQNATATIDFSIDGTAVESNQVSADGYEMNSPYEFFYCWYAADDTSLFMFVCLDNGYYAYTVEMAEDGTLNLLESGAYTYDL